MDEFDDDSGAKKTLCTVSFREFMAYLKTARRASKTTAKDIAKFESEFLDIEEEKIQRKRRALGEEPSRADAKKRKT